MGEGGSSSGGGSSGGRDADGHDVHEDMDTWFYAAGARHRRASARGASNGEQPASSPLPLVCLDLSGCTGVSDAAAVHLGAAACHLQQLRLQLCDQVGARRHTWCRCAALTNVARPLACFGAVVRDRCAGGAHH